MHSFSSFLLLAAGAVAGFVPPPTGMTTVLSKNYPGASISYKQTTICETTPGVKAWSGYVNLPQSLIADTANYNASIFFWYFESRNDPENAPTSLYLGGGPGTSSEDESADFPCTINPDSNSTTLNPFAFNNNVNMLYVDQPSGTGFSYSVPLNVTYNFVTQEFIPVQDPNAPQQLNSTVIEGTIQSPDPAFTANTTAQAARIMWRFAQIWLQEFPNHKTSNDELSVWGNSYAGFYTVGFFAYFQRQNERIKNGTINDSAAKPLNLATVGVLNGCIDGGIEIDQYPEYAFKNTYGYKAYPEEVYNQAVSNLTLAHEMVAQCRAAVAEGDPSQLGLNDTVNTICVEATEFGFGYIQGAFLAYSDRSPFDIGESKLSTYPPYYTQAFYAQRWVQEDLGAAINFTLGSPLISQFFFGLTGDPIRRSIDDLNALVDNDVKLALVFGDRDYRCNWLGGEAVSLNLAYHSSSAFRSAGYAPISTNATYTGGLVRQHGNVSFSRVFDAGHAVAAYQKETVYRIFQRAMFGQDVATGNVTIGSSSNYSSTGPASSLDHKNQLEAEPALICYVFSAPQTCAPNQLQALADGSAVVKDFVVVTPLPDLGNGTSGGGSGGNGNGTTTQPNAAGRMYGISGTAALSSFLGLLFLYLFI